MEKKKRAVAKSKFTRQESLLTEMLDNKAAKVIVSPQYEKLIECWNGLEEAHDNYIEVAELTLKCTLREWNIWKALELVTVISLKSMQIS